MVEITLILTVVHSIFQCLEALEINFVIFCYGLYIEPLNKCIKVHLIFLWLLYRALIDNI